MTARKTIEVGDLLERTNHILSLPHISQKEKKALAMMLECVLHATDNYLGWTYAAEDDDEQEWDRSYYVSKTVREDYDSCVKKRAEQDGLR